MSFDGVESCYPLNYVPPNGTLQSQLTIPVNVALLGNGGHRGDQVESVGWALKQYALCSYKKGNTTEDSETRGTSSDCGRQDG